MEKNCQIPDMDITKYSFIFLIDMKLCHDHLLSIVVLQAIEKTFDTAKHLKTKKDGKVSFKIPKVADIDSLLEGSVSFLKSLRMLRDFAEQNKGKVVSLKSFLEIVTQEVIDDIQNQVEKLRKMPME